MSDEQKAVFGSWIQAIGTITAAVGSTPSNVLTDQQLENLNLIGNVLQATGNAILADTEDSLTLNKIGNMLQAIGNSTVVTSIIIDFNERTKQLLEIQGNLLQATGGGVALADAYEQEKSIEQMYSIYGNLLQVIGNSMQALAGSMELKGEDPGNINVAGSWIQAIGSVISAIGETKYS
ncbi:DUF6944 family repetitive protein [Metabacillus idriensis]|uniref:DUF6944 family repetitive protein n=1 Tax=Metabacillus idriensis TaxID=324768 RepID=UPI001639D51E|nr:hypothetical protein [Metabacillus idriensis]QNG60421.1 hypothetical protein H4O14_02520 [Bacillus sp. PAMC26568]